ncbi:unnamed protein product [Lasius platythorax]|uniref:Uncharacterized protein n=1 Tax=Lasius platythorax TaxID=488582 RepID=A0AAV2MWQ6_9HYME
MTNCEILQYADDVAILSSSDSIQKGLDDLKSALEQIDRFLNCIGLELSPSKTKLCVFSYGLKETHNLEIAFKDHFIPNESTIKYFRYHTKKYFRTIKCLKYTWWGADPRVLLNLYIALIMSRLEYGGFLFHNLSKSSSLKLMRLQYKALRFVLGLRNSTPTNVILAEAKEPPLNLRRDYICRNFLTRVLSCENHPLIHKIEAIIDLEDDPIVVNRFMNIPLIDNFRVVQKYSHIISKHSIPLGYSFHFNSLLFIPNVLKALAILEALHFVSQKEIKQVSIFSDSKSVLESLMKSSILGKSSVLIVAIKDLVRRLESLGYEIKLIWIPAHKRIKGNEMADKKAKEAIRLGIDTQIQIIPGDLKLLEGNCACRFFGLV